MGKGAEGLTISSHREKSSTQYQFSHKKYSHSTMQDALTFAVTSLYADINWLKEWKAVKP